MFISFGEFLKESKMPSYKSLEKVDVVSDMVSNCSIYLNNKTHFYFQDDNKILNSDFNIFFPNEEEKVVNLLFLHLQHSGMWLEYPELYENMVFKADPFSFKGKGKVYKVIPYDTNNDNENTKIGYSVDGLIDKAFKNGLGYVFGKSNLSITYFHDVLYSIFKRVDEELKFDKLYKSRYYKQLLKQAFENYVNDDTYFNEVENGDDVREFLDLFSSYADNKETADLYSYITEYINPDFNMIKSTKYESSLRLSKNSEVWTDSPCLIINTDYEIQYIDNEVKLKK